MYLYYYKRTEHPSRMDKKELSHGLLKKALKDYNDRIKLGLNYVTIENLTIMNGPHGKPYFPELMEGKIGKHKPVFFSISHSGEWWACIVGDVDVGLDLEDLRRLHLDEETLKGDNPEWKRGMNGKGHRYQAIAKRYFTPDEFEYVLTHGTESFFDLWVRKEAYIKLKGTGLSEGLSSFHLLKDDQLMEKLNDAHIQEIKLASGVKAAFCSKEERVIKKKIQLFSDQT